MLASRMPLSPVRQVAREQFVERFVQLNVPLMFFGGDLR
jgi:hypothetical protein